MLEGITAISYCLKPATPCDSHYVACPPCRASVSTALSKMIDIAQHVANRNFNFTFPGTFQTSNATTAHMHHRKNFLHHSRRKFRPDTGSPSRNCWLHYAKLCRINTISHCDTARWTRYTGSFQDQNNKKESIILSGFPKINVCFYSKDYSLSMNWILTIVRRACELQELTTTITSFVSLDLLVIIIGKFTEV